MRALLFIAIAFLTTATFGQSYVSLKNMPTGFPLSVDGKSATIFANTSDLPGVVRAVKNLQQDVHKITDSEPTLSLDKIPDESNVVIVGTIGKSSLIDGLIKNKRLDVSKVKGKWETFIIQVIDKPMKGVSKALVIAGSDKRGTIFGIYDLAEQIGMSPWYWWADVPPKKNSTIYITPGRHVQGEPAVKYRGIFLNDEEPALGRWAVENYKGFTHEFYEKVFELILRMKGNYLWPAMWWASFNSNDTLNPKLADEYGIVIGTTHHEPMMRAHAEWKPYGGGEWNYATNEPQLRKFWTEGIQRMGSYESIVSLGMRGDGDMAMSKETNIALLERIVKDQREIIQQVTKKAPKETPQLWALYKEVQDYYDQGMRVPDDVTLLLCDDNWGNIRKLPSLGDAPRSGGYGIYYHFDYVGGPRNYKWLNTNQIERTWEQMHLANQYGANRIWIVNVGDLKPMEFPIEMFLDYAWNPSALTHDNLQQYTVTWAEQQFGSQYANEIAGILAAYTKFNSRRKHELISPETYSLTNYREAETIVKEFNVLAAEAERISNALPKEYQDAYYQLVLHPVKASAVLNELHITTAKNRLYAVQGRAATADEAEKVKTLFAKDASMLFYYNKIMANGKWDHMMDQTHISYTYWQQPPKDVLPALKEVNLLQDADMGVAIEGSEKWWPGDNGDAILPEFDNLSQQQYYLEIFNRGRTPFNYNITVASPLIVDEPSGNIEKEKRIWIGVDWKKVSSGEQKIPITIAGPNGRSVVIHAIIKNFPIPNAVGPNTFMESNGHISIEAEHFSRAVNGHDISWQRIPNLGRTLSAVTTFPVTAPVQTPGGNSPHLQYAARLTTTGDIKVHVYLSPTLNFHNKKDGFKYGISFDDGPVQIVNMHADFDNRAWEKAVANNVIEKITAHQIKSPGMHVLKFWMVDPAVVLQKIVIETKALKPSYLGPPESYMTGQKSTSANLPK
jgi:hypothetical protein